MKRSSGLSVTTPVRKKLKFDITPSWSDIEMAFYEKRIRSPSINMRLPMMNDASTNQTAWAGYERIRNSNLTELQYMIK